ncbi:BON domain-containing protein [Erythrobacter sp. sf7]|uniref:BON domain-containing protein n=1 Tax=Erythrobacter fulvus TaxID=2987523 RepID=A0ABT5JN90_9SPHN|nr:BON domain-containing protein [Erythrobacter fulvus]MDC8753981.1 BON domain-containing protein [Erythrobacter fulvus]
MHKTDSELQRDVLDELAWEPSIDHADIGVSVIDGVVALNGYVKSYAEKTAAERAAMRVEGVRAIADQIKVRYPSDRKTADHEIAKRILDIFAYDVLIPEDRIKVAVERGWVSLTGEVEWRYQSDEAARAAGKVSGVTGVSNNIAISIKASIPDIRERIEDAFKRQAGLDAASVTIATSGHKVTLGGTVKAWHERQLAEQAAWAAPGVTQVEDRIVIG